QETRSGTQAHTLDHHGAECAAVICQNSAVELDPSLVAVALKNPFSPRAWLNEHDPAVPLQILRLARIAISAQVRRSGTNHDSRLRELACHEPTVERARPTNSDVEAFLDEVDRAG